MLQKLTAAALLSAAFSAQAAPIFNLFELGANPAQTERYREIGEHNIRTSVAHEKGTLAMYSLQGEPFHYMAEIYADDAAYQTHLKSPQYQAFIAASPEILTDHKKRIDLVPQFLGDKPVIQTASTLVNLVIVEVKPEHNDAFGRIVRAEMAQSLKAEEGVRAMYAAVEKSLPNRWYFLEIYADEAAYQQHRQTPHFQAYLNETAAMTISKQAVAVTPVLLQNTGGLRFDVSEPQPEH